MISTEFDEPLWVPITPGGTSINMFAYGNAEAPINTLTAYCQRDQGTLEHLLLDPDVRQEYLEVIELTGLFACKTSADHIAWIANVDAQPTRGGLQPAFGYMLTVSDYSITQFKVEDQEHRSKLRREMRDAYTKISIFESRSTQPKSVGDQVCTWKNLYGYVTKVSGNQIQILMKGKASGEDGLFFDEDASLFGGLQGDKLMWGDSAKWGHCTFGPNAR